VTRHLLAATRFTLIVSGTAVYWTGAAIWSALADADERRARRALACRSWARYVLWVMGVDVRLAGALADDPHLLVSNHLSYIDILVLASTGDVTFVAKHEVASWPFIGSMCRFVETVFVRRSRGAAVNDAIDGIASVLASGRTVVLFPEGTSSDGRDVLPFYSPLLEAARRAGRPLGWAALAYDTPERPGSEAESVCWWGEMTLVGHCWRLLQLPAIEADVIFGDLIEPDDDRKALAADLRSAIVAARPPLRKSRSSTYVGAAL
jgi:1-acyl-sn-glycerol-3-phosphate acyltransferase